MLTLLLGYRHVSAPLVKLQKTLKESLEQPWLGSIQYSPAEGDRKTKQMYVIKIIALYVYTERVYLKSAEMTVITTSGPKPAWDLSCDWVTCLTVFELGLAEVQVLAGACRTVLGAERETHGLDLLSE